jgi:hypothetical protein
MLVFNNYFCKNRKSKLHFEDRVAVLNVFLYQTRGSICVLVVYRVGPLPTGGPGAAAPLAPSWPVLVTVTLALPHSTHRVWPSGRLRSALRVAFRRTSARMQHVYSIPNGSSVPSPALARSGPARYGPALYRPETFSCRAVSCFVPRCRPRHGPMAYFSGRAGTAPRTARWAEVRPGTIALPVQRAQATEAGAVVASLTAMESGVRPSAARGGGACHGGLPRASTVAEAGARRPCGWRRRAQAGAWRRRVAGGGGLREGSSGEEQGMGGAAGAAVDGSGGA